MINGVDCVKALKTEDFWGRGKVNPPSILQDNECAASRKKSRNQKGYIGRNQNGLSKYTEHSTLNNIYSASANKKEEILS